MSKKILAGAGAALMVCAIAIAKDPVIMTVNGVDVPLSEFEYLYHKNAQQQIEQQSLDEYVDMFSVYKMKVADALAEGLDTTKKFRDEYKQYRKDLAAPYITDSTLINKYAQEAYDFMKTEAEVKHIMLAKNRDASLNRQGKAKADSLLQCLKNGEDFEALAVEFSQDPSARQNRGNMGFVPFNRIPYYTFMKTAYTLPEGQLADEVVETPAGYHILLGGKKQPSQGQFRAAHIMKMASSRMNTQQQIQQAKKEIDSIYNIVKADPSKFEIIAKTESDDKNSGRQGGMLPWFGNGEMVPEFYDAVVALNDGEISEPVLSPYGWHIIHRIEHRDLPSYEESKPAIVAQITNRQDERAPKIMEAETAIFEKKFKGKRNEKMLGELREYVASNGMDSTFYAKFSAPGKGDVTLFSYGKDNFPVTRFLQVFNNYMIEDPETAAKTLDSAFERFYHEGLQDLAAKQLEKDNEDYKNLLNEFRDGSLLYEVSLMKVWDKASKDTEGLENYFRQHKGEYTWKKPHVKGYLVQAKNDSVAQLIQNRMTELAATDSLVKTIRKEFRGEMQIDRVLMEEGMNPMVDNLIFGAPKVQPSNSNFTAYFMFEPVIMKEPAAVEDVRGLVTSDYQNQLEKEWIEELRMKYPVSIDSKVVKKVK